MNLATGYTSNLICHACRAHKDDYLKAPSKLDGLYRKNLVTFGRESLKPGPKSVLVKHL